jgi:hypothetical integral membrane protein (TIGR02206 family)
MTAEAFNLLDPIHFLNVIFFIGAAVGIPLALKDSSRQTKNIFKYVLVAAILYHEITNPFFKITERGFDWWDAMPLHMCAFSTWCIAAYLVTKVRAFFVFAYFWGLTGGGMSILTPDTVLGFPSPEYLDTMYGHALILVGVFTAIFHMHERPYLKDYRNLMLVTTFVFLPLVYVFNLNFETNYWFVLEKPYGDNIMNFFPDAPYHLLALIPAAYAFAFLAYLPYLKKT